VFCVLDVDGYTIASSVGYSTYRYERKGKGLIRLFQRRLYSEQLFDTNLAILSAL
jgi:hypothetical protein